MNRKVMAKLTKKHQAAVKPNEQRTIICDKSIFISKAFPLSACKQYKWTNFIINDVIQVPILSLIATVQI